MKLLAAAACLVFPLATAAQVGPYVQSGPRFGVTYLTPGVVERINDATSDGGVGDRIDPSFPFVTQFGWQFEFQTFQTPSGATGIAEVVPLLSGLEHGLLAPSLTFLTGLRTPGGLEVGLGPNVSGSPKEPAPSFDGYSAPGGTDLRIGLALAAGTNTRIDGLSVPLTGAAVFGTGGARFSLLIGLNVTEKRY